MTTPELRRAARQATPARVLLGSAGLALPTSEALRLRLDHAAARDAVAAMLDPVGALATAVSELGGVSVETCASTPAEHLLRPDLGRRFSSESEELILDRLAPDVDVQIVVGDGLSASAVEENGGEVLRSLQSAFTERGLEVGAPLLVRNCRVGVLNHLGDLRRPEIAVLLIGERPGLATPTSMSAYLAHRPRSGCTDADRNCISNIHREGVSNGDAVVRIVALVEAMRRAGASGVDVKEPDALGREGIGPIERR